jgi:hypothetical protein
MSNQDIIPSSLDYGFHSVGNSGMFSNWRLRMGEVQEVIPPTDSRNISKKAMEYTVYVQELENGCIVQRMYNYVTVSTLFGSIADSLKYTLRVDPSAGRKDSQKNSGAGKGAKVLLLCINGDSRNAVIIGAIHDSNDVNDKAEGHNLQFVFNGVKININNDGELTLNVLGPTDLDGNPTSEIGSSVKIDKDGSVTVSVKNDVNVNCSKATITADKIQLGEDGIESDPTAGVVVGQAIEPLTGKFGWQLGWTSKNITAKK